MSATAFGDLRGAFCPSPWLLGLCCLNPCCGFTLPSFGEIWASKEGETGETSGEDDDDDDEDEDEDEDGDDKDEDEDEDDGESG